MVHELQLRINAVAAWFMAQGNPVLACMYFVMISGTEHGVIALESFIRRWATHFENFGSVLARYMGRQHRMPLEIARECVTVLLAGYQEVVQVQAGGMCREEVRQKYFRSIGDAVNRSPFLRQKMKEYDITPGTLLRTLQHAAPGLRKRHLNPRRALSPANMASRVEVCRKLLGMGERELLRQLSRMFWIDSKTFYIEPEGLAVWAPADANMAVVDQRMPHSLRERKKIVYYAVVNALLGPVYIEYMTGTTGHEQDVMRPPWLQGEIPVYHEYQVSLARALLYCPHSHSP